jgi:internalin A
MENNEILKIIDKAFAENFTSLNLSGKEIQCLPKEIGRLTGLHALDLGYNPLKTLPPDIGNLRNLTSLILSWCRIEYLPPEIGQLECLELLDLGGNRLSRLPEEIGENRKLIFLIVKGNCLENLPKSIGQLINLKNLDVSNNRLKYLPVDIGGLKSLQYFNLTWNSLIQLPIEMGRLRNLKTLKLADNNLISPPIEIRTKSAAEIVNFYRQQIEQNSDYLYEAKLLILGEGGAGKTTLAKKIHDRNYQLHDQEESTKGIDVIQWQFKFNKNKEFRVNIWDFGGQEIYHATHQFFLTKRSLYILVADSRKEDTDFYYWLNVVELLSGNSPLLIVKNEKQDRKREINESELRGEFNNLKETLATNLSNNRGLAAILTQIKHSIRTLPHVGTELPKTWVKVREALEQDSRNYINLEKYLQICQDNGFTRREDKFQLSGYLHDLGVCLHFQEDDLLIKTVILKPTWGTDAVYKVLDNPQVIQKQGKFTRNDLNFIWHEDKYCDMCPELLRLMMNFKLCYEIPGLSGTYIAPQLLTPNQPKYDWYELDNLLLRYEYEFMPKGILTRFIVEMHNYIEKQATVWKRGVVLIKDGARAEVIELYRYHKGEIRIRISGKRKRDLLTTIRHELGKIHDSYERLKYKTQVPCNCSTCKAQQNPFFFDLKRLYVFSDKGKPNIQCHESGEDVLVKGLIDDLVTTGNSPQNSNTKSQQESTYITQNYYGTVHGAAGQVHDQNIQRPPSKNNS